jgi:hypothetical protein
MPQFEDLIIFIKKRVTIFDSPKQKVEFFYYFINDEIFIIEFFLRVNFQTI